MKKDVIPGETLSCRARNVCLVYLEISQYSLNEEKN
jgi:hypothetical protein